jgi:hypothetical protein
MCMHSFVCICICFVCFAGLKGNSAWLTRDSVSGDAARITVYVRMYVCAYVYMYVCVHACVCLYLCVCIYVCARVRGLDKA